MATSFQAIGKYKADPYEHDPGRGKHFWTIIAMYKINDPEKSIIQGIIADQENLVTVDGIGCFKCEELYSPELAKKWCNGV